jgi:type I restriction enzyme S subunit
VIVVPKGWVLTVTGEVAQIVGGGTPDASVESNFSSETGVPWITPADLSGFEEMYVSRGRRFLTPQGYKRSSAKLMPKGTVVFSSRAPIGYVAVAATEISTNQGFKSFICENGVLPEYLYYYLRFAKPLAEELASGTTFPEISGRNAAQIPFLFPSTSEQLRIVAKLDALLGKVDACQRRLDKIPVLLKRLRQSVLAAACSGRLTADWRSANMKMDFDEKEQPIRLGDLLAQIKTGPFGSALHKADYVTGGVPIVNPMHINDGEITPISDMSITESKAIELSEYRLKEGDVVIGRRGAMGRCAVVGPYESGWLCGTGTMILRPSALLLPEYLQRFLSSPPVILALEADAVGTTMVNLNQGILSGLELYLPSIPEQHEIVRRVEALFAIADQIEARYAKAKGYVGRLTQSILAKAFRGELVPQEPDNEPASVLLERIREQRASAVAAPATRKPRSGGTAPTTLEPATPPPARRGRPPKEALPSPDLSASNGGQTDIPLSKPARKILKRMKPGREHARADLADALGLSVGEWNAGINELKDAGLVVQSGERRGARYRIEK